MPKYLPKSYAIRIPASSFIRFASSLSKLGEKSFFDFSKLIFCLEAMAKSSRQLLITLICEHKLSANSIISSAKKREMIGPYREAFSALQWPSSTSFGCDVLATPCKARINRARWDLLAEDLLIVV